MNAIGTAQDNRVYRVRNDAKGRKTLYVEAGPKRWIALKRVEDLDEAAEIVSQVSGGPFSFQLGLRVL